MAKYKKSEKVTVRLDTEHIDTLRQYIRDETLPKVKTPSDAIRYSIDFCRKNKDKTEVKNPGVTLYESIQSYVKSVNSEEELTTLIEKVATLVDLVSDEPEDTHKIVLALTDITPKLGKSKTEGMVKSFSKWAYIYKLVLELG